MTVVTATELKNRLGQSLMTSMAEPVFIEKSGKVQNVLLSEKMYREMVERLEELEDLVWGTAAESAEKEGFVASEESKELLGL